MLATGAGEPLRVAVAPAGWFDRLTVPERYSIPTLLHLHDRFKEVPGVLLADEGWTGTLLGEFAGGKRIIDESGLFAEFTACLPVDAMVRVIATETELRCIVLTAQGARTETIPLTGKPTVQSVCETAAAHVVKALALPTDAARIMTERRVKNPEQFEALLLARRIMVHYPNSIAEARLQLLQKFVGTPDATNLVFAAGVVHGLRTISNGRASSPLVVQRGVEMARMNVVRLLGTEFEEQAHPILRELAAAFATDLLGLVKPLSGDLLDLSIDETKAPKEDDLLGKAESSEMELALTTPGAAPMLGPMTQEQRFGALRCLGVIANDKALVMIRVLIKGEDPRQRQAAAEALRHYEGKTGIDLLGTLAGDADPRVAFVASYGLWKRGQPSLPSAAAKKKAKSTPKTKGSVAQDEPVLSADEKRAAEERVLKLARQFSHDTNPACQAAAREAICLLGTREDVELLTTWSVATDPAVRSAAVEALLRLGAVAPGRWQMLLRDPSANVVMAALDRAPADADPAAMTRMRLLANNPLAGVAQAARLACARYQPADPRARLQFNLAVEHPYIRSRLIDRLATNPSPVALEDLAAACTNSEPHTRTHAMTRLTERDPSLARLALAKALMDPYHWVRLHAAARLADVATAAEADAIRHAQAAESDPATRLYLADALARAEGRPKPPPAMAVHSVAGKTNLTWLCGAGEGCETSPFGAYYLLDGGNIGEPLQRAHAAGKILFARVTPVGNAGTLITDSSAMDGFWLSLQSQITTNNLPHLDGVVYGEETMSAGAGPLWKNGWPLFCFDAGIDPARIQGVQTNLAPYEARAWNHWALTQTVEGFNALYDYTKLRFGKLRPGLQVCTFLPGQGAAGPADRRWKFDVGGIYDYKGNNRVAAYTLIRRMKTLWPDRPVLWMSLGIGGYEMNPVRYTQKTPDAPLMSRGDRAYADSVAAWLAGADNGWFSTWIFISPKARPSGMAHLKGVQILVEDIVPNSKTLKQAIGYSFAKVDEIYKEKAEGGPPKIDAIPLGEEPEAPLELEEKKPGDDPFFKQVEQEKERMRIGFHFYGKYVYDCARVFASLPRLHSKPEVLAVKPGLSVWSSGGAFAASGHNLLNAYDFLMDINQVPDTDLSRYRLIAVDGLDEAPLADRTIASISGWLKERPGLLYVRGALSTNEVNEASTAEDHDGVLKQRWPWVGEVGLLSSTSGVSYAVSGPNVTVLAKGTQGPSLVLWRAPENKGAVIFDAGLKEATGLREAINKLAREHQVGVELTGPPLQMVWREAGITGAACSGGSVSNILTGVDLLDGSPNPGVGPGRSGALVSTNLVGKYAASLNGVAVLGEAPLAEVAPVAGGLRVRCAELLRAGGQHGHVSVAVEGGGRLAEIEPEKANEWVLFGKADGFLNRSIRGNTNKAVTFIRCSQTVVVTTSPAR